jgi:hypothetical protein
MHKTYTPEPSTVPSIGAKHLLFEPKGDSGLAGGNSVKKTADTPIQGT